MPKNSPEETIRRPLCQAGCSVSDTAAAALREAVKAAQARAGGFCLFDPAHPGREPVAAVFESRRGNAAVDWINTWRRSSPAFRASIQWLEPQARPSGRPPSPAMSLQDRISGELWMPLKDGERSVGFLRLELLRTPSPQTVEQLSKLAATAVQAVYRALLHERMAQAGAPIQVVGGSERFLAVERQIRVAAAAGVGPVLVTGERGSGKEAAGWAVHCWSSRCARPFVPVLSSALPKNLAVAELFGHERHAFTDAARKRPGRFKAADGGTIFLDEVTDLGRSIQPSLLRVIEYQEVCRLGSDQRESVDVRVVSSTNRDVARLVRNGKFRADLYDRLSVFEIRLPPLRERPEDVRPLAEFFLRKHCQQLGRRSEQSDLSDCGGCRSKGAVCAEESFFAALEAYHWPGNIRELKTAIVRLTAAHPFAILRRRHVERFLGSRARSRSRDRRDLSLDSVMRNHIVRVLRRVKGNQSRAAALLGLPLSTFRGRLKKLKVDPRRYRLR